MDPKKEFLTRFSKIRQNPKLLKVLRDFHKKEVENYTNNLKLELEETLYHPFIFVHQIDDNISLIKAWIKHTFTPVKGTKITSNSVLDKFQKIKENSEVYQKLKKFYQNYLDNYITQLKKLLHEDRFHNYIKIHEIDQYAATVKKILEKKNKSVQQIQKDLKEFGSEKVTLKDIFESPKFKALRAKVKKGNQENLEKEIRKLLRTKLAQGSQKISENQSKDQKEDFFKILEKAKTQGEKIYELQEKINEHGFNHVIEEEALKLLKEELLKELPDDNRSKYYQEKIEQKLKKAPQSGGIKLTRKKSKSVKKLNEKKKLNKKKEKSLKKKRI